MSYVRTLAAATVFLAMGTFAWAQALRGVVVDQMGFPIPGVRLTSIHNGEVAGSAVAAADGTFVIASIVDGDLVEAALEGFETATVPASAAERIVLPLAHATDRTEVNAPLLAAAGVATETLGSALTTSEQRTLPSARRRALEVLPLLPSVMRGQDGLLRLGGTRPHESTLWIDGFDVTDPVTGTSNVDLPLEAVQSVAVLRDPIGVVFGGMLGALASVDTVSGADTFSIGIQDFVPQPRLSRYGFGQIEGFYPRVYSGGRVGRLRYFAAQEFDYERIAVPGVTSHAGRPTIGQTTGTSFSRIDVSMSPSHTVTLEGIFVPGRTAHAGLSSVREESATPSIRTGDLFAGVIDRIAIGTTNVMSFRVGTTAHVTEATPSQSGGIARLTPDGWRGLWPGSADYRASRQSYAVSWDRAGIAWHGQHLMTTLVDIQHREMNGGTSNHPIRIEDGDGRLVRTLAFGPASRFRRADTVGNVAVRDAWELSSRLQLDAGFRIDWYGRSPHAAGSPRLGARFVVDRRGLTILKGGIGRFTGRIPLDALAFNLFPSRTDTSFGAETGAVESVLTYQPVLRTVGLPRADTVMLELERRLGTRFQLQVSARQRVGSHLPTVYVPLGGGPVELASTGRSTYRELQLVARQSWGDRSEIFVSYVRSRKRAELNDYGSLFATMSAPLLQHGAMTISTDDVPNRVVSWSTISLPFRLGISPAVEWHTGFPYSPLDVRRQYEGQPNAKRFPAFVSLDLVTYKTVDIRALPVDLGLQLFNVTGHFNPRDVRPVSATPGSRRFDNSVGLTIEGYMMVKWQ